MTYEPKPEHKFTFGLWTVGNPGSDPFGEPVREVLSPVADRASCSPRSARTASTSTTTTSSRSTRRRTSATRSSRDFKKALEETGLVVPMATTNLFRDPVFKDGAFTATTRGCAPTRIQKTMRAIDLGVELGAKIYVFWGGREGVETDAAKDPVERDRAVPRGDQLPLRVREGPGVRPAVRARGEAERAARRHLPADDRRDARVHRDARAPARWSGVNPEVAHEHMAGLNFDHHVAQAWSMGKLFHIDLNDQELGRYDQDFRFGSANLKAAFFLVKFLEDVGLHGQPALRRARVPHRRTTRT